MGAGVSRAVTDGAGKALFPDWKELLVRTFDWLRGEGKDAHAKVAEGLIDLGRLLEAARECREGLGALCDPFLREQLDVPFAFAKPEGLDLAKAIWGLGSQLVITTNYNRVMRWASPNHPDLREYSVSDRANLADLSKEQNPCVWHLHGTMHRPEEIILAPDGYGHLNPEGAEIRAKYEAALVAFRHQLSARSLLFVVFGT